MSRLQPRLLLLLLFLGSLILFTYGLSSQEIISFDSRFYLFAQEMKRHGLSWFPATYHHPYPDYLAASTVLIYVCSLITGNLTKLTAVLPSAICAAFTLVLTYQIGNRQCKNWGVYAAFFLLLNIIFIKSARSISLDMYVTAITTACFYLAANQKKERWIYILLWLSFLFRGPIGLIIPCGAAAICYFVDRQFHQLVFFLSVSFFLLLISISLLLLMAFHIGGLPFLHDVFNMEITGRMSGANLPVYFYITNSFGNYAPSYPFALAVLAGVLFYRFKKPPISDNLVFLAKLSGWMMIVIVGMSIPAEKKVRYILPVLPAISLMAAYPFAAPASQKYFVFLKKNIQVILFCIPTFFIVALFFMSHPYLLNNEVWFSIFSILQFINISAYYFIQEKFTRDIFIFISSIISVAIVTIFIIEPLEIDKNKARDFTAIIEQKRIQQRADLVFYKESPDGLPIKYLINMPKEDKAYFIQQEQEIMAYIRPAFFCDK